MSDDEFPPDSGHATTYGFKWGPMEVTRCATLEDGKRRSRVVQIKAGTRTLDVYVSETGRSIRVFEGGREWRP